MREERGEPLPKTPWESLSRDETDLFENPHYYQTTKDTLVDRATSVLDRLDKDGLQNALDVLNNAVTSLKKYDRNYPHLEVDAIREKIKERMGE